MHTASANFGEYFTEWNGKAAAGLYTPADYHEGDRNGLLMGFEIAPGRFLFDADIDWKEGYAIAAALLPQTDFVYGRASKWVSHCVYTTPEPLPSVRYEDIDKTALIEQFGTAADGTLGHQIMAPPAWWSKEGKREQLEFRAFGTPTFIDDAPRLKHLICLAAIGMILAKHLGR